jgi:hypothetical protein
LQHASSLSPESLQPKDELLKSQRIGFGRVHEFSKLPGVGNQRP